MDSRVNYGISVGKERGFIHKGDLLVVITGWRQGFWFVHLYLGTPLFSPAAVGHSIFITENFLSILFN